MLDEAARDQRLTQILAEDCAERFDLAAPPLLRFTLVGLGAERHRLLFSSHHIVMDGWSMPVLIQELLTLYAQRGDGGSLPRVTPYRDYLSWLAGQDHAAAVAAWSTALAGLEEATLLAPHAARQAPALPEQILLTVDASLTAALMQQARARSLTVNTYIQGAWAVLLGRLTGRDDVVFGVTVAGRPPEIAGIESMVGLFINTLPLRIKLSPDQPLVVLLSQLQDSQSRLMAHQHLGLAEIQGLVGLGELFDTLVVFENYPVDQAALAKAGTGLNVTPSPGMMPPIIPLSSGAPGEQLRLRLDYRPDLFARTDAEAMGGRLIRLLDWRLRSRTRDRAAGHARQLPSGRPFCANGTTPRSRSRLPAAWLFAAEVARTPDAVAVVFGEEALSYGDLERGPIGSPITCARSGSGPRSWSGCACRARSTWWWGCSAFSRPAASTCRSIRVYPPERFAFMLEDTRAPLLLTQSGSRGSIPNIPSSIVEIDADWSAIAHQPTTALRSGLHHLNTAYVIYTSGSTGTPKGVVVNHYNIVRLVREVNYVALAPDAVVLHMAPFTFDASTFEIWVRCSMAPSLRFTPMRSSSCPN